MMRLTSPATGLTRSWIRCYTLGLSRDTRVMRQQEIESDLWEHERDMRGNAWSRVEFALSVLSRLVRGMPADVFWRFQMEGPKVEIKIPFERVAGGLLLALVAMIMIVSSINGYDTNREGFESELRRLASLDSLSDNMNAVARLLTGVGLIAAAAGFYVALRERGAMLATIAAFGLVAAGALAFVAAALQLVVVELAEQYIITSPPEQGQVLVTARTVLLIGNSTVGGLLASLLLSVYSLAALTARAGLVPRWLSLLPVMSFLVLVVGSITTMAGYGNAWVLLMSVGGLILLWSIIAGLWLLFTPQEERAAAPLMSQAS